MRWRLNELTAGTSLSKQVGTGMRQYVIRRMLLGVVTLFVISFISFMLLRLTPGDAIMAKVAAGGVIAPERLEEMRADLGLDEPIPVQYVRWLGDMLRGDFGQSFTSRESTLSNFLNVVPVTLELGIIALCSGIIIALPVGIISALKQDTAMDYIGRAIAVAGISFPTFF